MKYKSNLKNDGFIAYEIGYDQGDTLRKIAEENGMSCEIIKDLSGNDRVAVLKIE
jgi:release factor glutamine methyltransferase